MGFLFDLIDNPPVDAEACWLWPGRPRPDGYGVTSDPILGSTGYAHRIVYRWLVGPIPHEMQLDHLCRVKLCVNPAHLEVVTGAENIRRAAGRFGHVRQLPSGNWQALYSRDGTKHKAPGTFADLADAEAWLQAADRRDQEAIARALSDLATDGG